MGAIAIKSDFEDYYDSLSDDKSSLVYKRYMSDNKQRATALKYLRSIGIKTIEVKPVSEYFIGDGPIVVYTDTYGHDGRGKQILTVDKAIQSYSNCIASIYYGTSEISVKFLQIGKRRFKLVYKKLNTETLELGQLIDIKESISEYNYLIGKPIFSIDYIYNGIEMVATDFNEVQNLRYIGIDKFISANDVISEIHDALIAYNKY